MYSAYLGNSGLPVIVSWGTVHTRLRGSEEYLQGVGEHLRVTRPFANVGKDSSTRGGDGIRRIRSLGLGKDLLGENWKWWHSALSEKRVV